VDIGTLVGLGLLAALIASGFAIANNVAKSELKKQRELSGRGRRRPS
jgi:hypothetical protein